MVKGGQSSFFIILFLFISPAVGGLLPPVAGRDGTAAEKFIIFRNEKFTFLGISEQRNTWVGIYLSLFLTERKKTNQLKNSHFQNF